MFTIEELEIMVEALGTLIAEYGDRPDRVALHARLVAEREARRAELARHR